MCTKGFSGYPSFGLNSQTPSGFATARINRLLIIQYYTIRTATAYSTTEIFSADPESAGLEYCTLRHAYVCGTCLGECALRTISKSCPVLFRATTPTCLNSCHRSTRFRTYCARLCQRAGSVRTQLGTRKKCTTANRKNISKHRHH